MSNTILHETKYNSLLKKTCLIYLEGRRRLSAAAPPPHKKKTYDFSFERSCWRGGNRALQAESIHLNDFKKTYSSKAVACCQSPYQSLR